MTLNPSKAEDPTVAIALVVIAVLTMIGLVGGPFILHADDKDVWDLVIKAAGASVVLLGSYFAARTLKQSRADQRDARILTAIGLVGNERPEVRVGALLALGELAKTTAGTQRDDYLAAIRETVRTVAEALYRTVRARRRQSSRAACLTICPGVEAANVALAPSYRHLSLGRSVVGRAGEALLTLSTDVTRAHPTGLPPRTSQQGQRQPPANLY